MRVSRQAKAKSWLAPAESERARISPSSALCGQLLERKLQHAQVIFGVVRAGVPRPQDPGEHLPPAGHEQRVEAEPALVVAGRVLLLGVHVIGVASKSRITRSGAAPACHARARASAVPARIPSSSPSPIESSTRRAVETEATSPNSAAAQPAPQDPRRSARRRPPSPPDRRAPGRDHGPSGARACPQARRSARPSARAAAAISANSAVPAREDKPVPSALTSTVLIVERPITFKVNLLAGGLLSWQPQSSPPGRTMQTSPNARFAALLTNRG